MLLLIPTIALMESNCHRKHFTCTNKRCANASLVCDGTDDCGDNSDETIGCTGMLILIIKNQVEF